MIRFASFLVCCVLCAGAFEARAQVEPSATRAQSTLTVGAIGSVFQPDYSGNNGVFVSGSAPNALWGVGGYVDFNIRRWIGIEAEGRWLHFNQYADIYQNNYLIGPRVQIKRYGKFTPYGKALFGYGSMNFVDNLAYGRFADIALGGGVDYDLSRKISIRAFDFEYQLWPNWVNGTLKPYGASVGVAYKVF
jgi:Outer membrane protein beta-barrel domain